MLDRPASGSALQRPSLHREGTRLALRDADDGDRVELHALPVPARKGELDERGLTGFAGGPRWRAYALAEARVGGDPRWPRRWAAANALGGAYALARCCSAGSPTKRSGAESVQITWSRAGPTPARMIGTPRNSATYST
jgi:hypothetical protein